MAESNEEIVVDCSSKIIGRLASKVAKMLLEGNRVTMVNAEKAEISGHENDLVEKYKRKVELKDKANPEHSPYVSRRPDLFVKRIVRGMLPFKKAKGKEAYKRLKVYMGVPEAYKNKQMQEIDAKNKKDVFEKTMSIAELSRKLGYKNSKW
ncbi:MAG: 50S ribosomal protein L13 [Candidatus Micrarchaeia archaeon]